MKNKRILMVVLSVFLIMSMPLTAIAHSGRTDSRGGHKDNKNKSGLGSYHYHCGGYPPHLHNDGVCPYTDGGSTTKKTTPKTVYATKITAVNVPSTIGYGESAELEGAVYPTDAQDKTIEWKSNNPEIVTVTTSGNLQAVGIGTATVTATTSRGTSSTFTITVTEVLAQSIVIKNKITDMLVGEEKSFSVDFVPDNTTNKTVEWSVSDTSIAEIDEKGTLTAIGTGTVTVTAKASNGIETETTIEIYSDNLSEQQGYGGIIAGGVGTAVLVVGGSYYFIRKRKKKAE